jgi:hypothetical protein
VLAAFHGAVRALRALLSEGQKQREELRLQQAARDAIERKVDEKEGAPCIDPQHAQLPRAEEEVRQSAQTQCTRHQGHAPMVADAIAEPAGDG